MDMERKLAIAALVGTIGIAGTAALVQESASAEPSAGIPLSETSYVLGDPIETYNRFMMSGGPPPDGIPSIDEPRFVSASAARLDGGDLVIGYHHRGEARAYPQKILVHHEIVNDRVGGLNVAITYCPLTATAQGFQRGSTTLGVSGRLLNSNLVMYDRETGTLFPQIAATGLTGPDKGRTLVEVNLVWTTWEKWRARYPNTRVLSERTGHLRNYSRDPYGSYNPRGGYYRQQGTIFPRLHESRRHHDKAMVVGARTADRSVYFVMADLARVGVLRSANFVAVYDPALDVGHIYRIEGKQVDVRRVGPGAYELDGERYPADRLPLDRTVPVEAFFFAWHAFYPESEFATATAE